MKRRLLTLVQLGLRRGPAPTQHEVRDVALGFRV